jgi:hypothetical protein
MENNSEAQFAPRAPLLNLHLTAVASSECETRNDGEMPDVTRTRVTRTCDCLSATQRLPSARVMAVSGGVTGVISCHLPRSVRTAFSLRSDIFGAS